MLFALSCKVFKYLVSDCDCKFAIFTSSAFVNFEYEPDPDSHLFTSP